MLTVVQYCNIWIKQKHLLALLSFVWISAIVHASDNVCCCFQLEVVASDGSEMGASKPVICLFNICLCMCVGNLTVQIHIPPYFKCFQCAWGIIEDMMFSSLSSDYSCNRMNFDGRLFDSSQCCTYILMWVKFLIEDVLECLTMHAI